MRNPHGTSTERVRNDLGTTSERPPGHERSGTRSEAGTPRRGVGPERVERSPIPPARNVVKELRALGCALAARRGRLRVRPADHLSEVIRSWVRERSDEIVTTLQDSPPEGPCPACSGRLFVYAQRGVPSCVECFGIPEWVPERWCWYLEDIIEPVEEATG